MIDKVREYLVARVAQEDSSLKQNDSAFYDDDIPETTIEETYQVQINDFVSQERNAFQEDVVECVLSIFGYGYRAQTENYDCLFDKAICIRNHCIDLKNVQAAANEIVNVTSAGINAVAFDTDETGYRFDINLTVTLGYEVE